MCSALSEDDAADAASADSAGFTFPAIDAMQLLKPSRVTVAVDVIGNRGATVFDGRVQHLQESVE